MTTRLVVDHDLSEPALAAACSGAGVLEVDLRAAPGALPRIDLLLPIARFAGFLHCRFEGRLTTPLTEVACLSSEAEWPPGASLDFRDALLAPLVLRMGPARARRILAAGAVAKPGDVLLPWRGRSGRSAVALALTAPLLSPGMRSASASLARERAAFASALATGELAEGVLAFRERRSARFDW